MKTTKTAQIAIEQMNLAYKKGRLEALKEVEEIMEEIIKEEKESHGEADALTCWYQLKAKLQKKK